MPVPPPVRRRFVLLASAAAGLLLLTGCQTYKDNNLTLRHWRAGQLEAAEKTSAERLKKHVTRDGVLNQLEHATVLRGAGKVEESLAGFRAAEARIDAYEEAAKTSVSGEVGKTLSNQAQAEYKGRDYDKILLNTYQALNYLALGKREEAINEIIRAYQRQQDAVEENKKRLEKVQREKEESKEKDKVDKAADDPRFQKGYAAQFGDLETMRTYSDYVNPFTVFLDALLHLTAGGGGSDLERARTSLARVQAYAPDNQFIPLDLEAAENVAQGRALPPTTYVLFETGCAPVRDQVRLDIPTFAGPGYVGAAFPKLVPQPDYLAHLTVATAAGSHDTALIASIDSVVGTAFKNELPTIITKTMVSTITKAAASWATKEAAKQAGGDVAGLFAVLATSVYQVAVNIADTRTWTTLPKEFQYCRLPTPPDRKLELKTSIGQSFPVLLQEGTVNVVYVRSISRGTPLLVSQFKLK